jgi:hypothetical protein
MQPVGDTTDDLISQLGIIAKNGRKLPLTFVSWSVMPKDKLDLVWNEVQVYLGNMITNFLKLY